MTKPKNEGNRVKEYRVSSLRKLAADLFGRPTASEERVRTVLMGVPLGDEYGEADRAQALEPFRPLAVDLGETRERLEWLLDEWTSATQFVIEECKGLFSEQPEILVLAAAERDFDAERKAKKAGVLSKLIGEDGKPVMFPLGEKLKMPILVYGKSGKDGVCRQDEVGGNEKKLRYCVEVADGRFIKLSKGVDNSDEEANGDQDDSGTESDDAWRISKFSARTLGGFLSTAYFSDRPQKGERNWSPEVLEFALNNQRRVRPTHLSQLDSKPNEGMRQQCAQAVCSFLEKYLSVQPEVAALKRQHDSLLGRWRGFLKAHGSELGELGESRRDYLEAVIVRRPDCDPSDWAEVEQYRDWVRDFNRIAKELQDVLPESVRDEMENQKIRLLKDVKGYPTFPSYKPDHDRDFNTALAEIVKHIPGQDAAAGVDAEWLGEFVLRTWADPERYRKANSRQPDLKPDRQLPVLKRVARKLFEETGGIIGQDESTRKWAITWNPNPDDLRKLLTDELTILAAQRRRLEKHLSRKGGDYLAKRTLVDCVAALARLARLGTEADAGLAAEINASAGRAKGALLALAEGVKREMQLSGFSGKCEKGTCSLQKGVCLLIAGEPGKERLALFVDFTKDKDKPVKIIIGDNFQDGLRAAVSVGGSKKLGKGKAKQLVVGAPQGEIGHYGLVLPLRFSTSQARRYLYPNAGGKPEDGIVAAMQAGGVDIHSARVLSRMTPRGVRYEVALSVGIPVPKYDLNRRKPLGFIGIDRGETDLAVFARIDAEGRLAAEPSAIGRDMVSRVRKAYRRIHRQQSRAKRLEGGDWLESRIFNAVRVIATKGVHMMLKDGAALAFEDLPRGFARGGTASWEHQYTKVEDEVADVLRYCGLLPHRAGSKLIHFNAKSDRPMWFGKVGAAWTSQTCPKCAAIWGKAEKLEKDGAGIRVVWNDRHQPLPGISWLALKESGGKWATEWPDGRGVAIELPLSVSSECKRFVVAKNEKERKEPRRRIFEWISHRSRDAYHRFRCRRCGVELDANKIGALNIARKALLQSTVKKAEKDEDKRLRWQKWYMEIKGANGWWDARAERMLR